MNNTKRSNKTPNSLRNRPKPRSILAQGSLAVAVGVATNCPAIAQSDNSNNDKESNAIELIEVYGQRLAPYKALRSGDDRRGADLADLPQTLSILTQTQIEDSGKTDLKEILSAQSGITLGTGENGNAFGDRYIIRGHEARSDVFVDGLRDPGMTTRESFANEQVEITKGPSATFAGRGSSGGAVNSVTKQANADKSFNVLKVGVGSDEFHRATLDSNFAINDKLAVRVNLLHAQEDAPNRESIEKERIGGLFSAALQATEKLSFVADYYHLEANDVPDLGSYFDQTTRSPINDIPVYAQDSDFLDTNVDSLTLKTNYQFSENVRLQNATRFGQTENQYITTGIRGSVRADTDPEAPGATTATLSTHQGWQEVDYMVNQLNLFVDKTIGNTQHKMVFGLEYSDESVVNGVFSTENTGATNCITSGRRGDAAAYCAIDATGNYVSNLNSLLGRVYSQSDQDADQNVKTTSLYAMDNITFNNDWSAFFGVRFDDFSYDNTVVRQGVTTDYEYSDSLWNGHLGLVRNITENGNVYLTYSTATNINGGESDVGSSCGYGGLCGTAEQVGLSDPEQVQNIELGTKWELFDQRALATAALFSITKSDVMESVGDDYSTLGTLNTGKNRVQGVEFSITGAITDKLSAQFNATMMDSEVLEAFDNDTVGLALSNFADNQAYLQLRYDATSKLSFGGSITHKSEMYGGQPDTAAGFSEDINDYTIVVPSYEVIDLFVNYYPSDNFNLKLNIGNVTDEEYFTAAYRSGSFMYLGDARSIRASMTYSF